MTDVDTNPVHEAASRLIHNNLRLGRNEVPQYLNLVAEQTPDIPRDVLGIAAMMAWSSAEFPCYYLSWTRWKKLLRGAPKTIDYPVMLYRGQDTKGWSDGIDNGASWTTEQQVAEFFAQRSAAFATSKARYDPKAAKFKNAQPEVLSFVLTAPNLIIAVYPPGVGRGESEVILDPTKLRSTGLQLSSTIIEGYKA